MTEPVLGIDLGTTNSVLATVEDGRPCVVPSRFGHRLTPSMVGFLSGGERVVGHRARLLAEECPEDVAFATKRFIGMRWTEQLAALAKAVVPYPLVRGPSSEFQVVLAGRTFPLTQISAMILGELYLDAQAYFGRPVRKAVVTVPANFDDGQRMATKQAAQIAGLELMRIVNEPTAAALAYGLARGFKGRALVFDLGGGTFDVSVLEIQDGVFEVKGSSGHPHLGGEDFDNKIVAWLLGHLDAQAREAISNDKPSMQRLKTAAENAKRGLSTAEEVRVSLTGLREGSNGEKEVDLDVSLTRHAFESMCDALCRKCIAVCERVMGEVSLEPKSVDALLLVGGMTRVPRIRRAVSSFFGREPVERVDPDEVVALGAAVQASEIGNTGGAALLIDVASHSLGVGFLGRHVRRIIAKNTPVPVTAREVFLPGRAGQAEALVPIYQGEGKLIQTATKLGEVRLKNLGAQNRSDAPIEVSFELATDGTLSVRATHPFTKVAETLRIEARTDLTPEQVEALALQQREYAAKKTEEDFEAFLEGFGRVLEQGEKLIPLLENTAKEESSPGAPEMVETLRSLLVMGKEAATARQWETMAALKRRLDRIIGARQTK